LFEEFRVEIKHILHLSIGIGNNKTLFTEEITNNSPVLGLRAPARV
jgi:hypothetical protein